MIRMPSKFGRTGEVLRNALALVGAVAIAANVYGFGRPVVADAAQKMLNPLQVAEKLDQHEEVLRRFDSMFRAMGITMNNASRFEDEHSLFNARLQCLERGMRLGSQGSCVSQ